MMTYSEFTMLWQLFQIFQCVICLWIAFFVVQQRGTGRWLIVTSAILQSLVYIAAWHVPRIATDLSPARAGVMGMLMISMAMGTCISMFLLGLLLYLSGQKSDAKRIADLEAIIREHDLTDEARMKSG